MVDRSSSPAAPFVAGAQSDQLRLPLRSSHERRGKEVKASGSGLSPQRQLPLQIYPCGDEFASDIATSSGMPLPSHLVGPLHGTVFGMQWVMANGNVGILFVSESGSFHIAHFSTRARISSTE